MDAFNFIKELNRLCNHYYDCDKCPLSKLNGGGGCGVNCKDTDAEINKMISTVETWAKEHPRKTFLQDLLEKYPNIKINECGIPHWVCPDTLGYCEDNSFCNGHTCKECWNRPLEE